MAEEVAELIRGEKTRQGVGAHQGDREVLPDSSRLRAVARRVVSSFGTVVRGSQGLSEQQRALAQEAKNWPNNPLQEKFRRGILRGLINTSDTP